MSVFYRIKLRANNDHAKNFATILEKKYPENTLIEQIFVDTPAKAFILNSNILEVATYTPLKRNESSRAPINFEIESYPLSNIIKITESYEEHSLLEDVYKSIKTIIVFKDGEKLEINDLVGLNESEILNQFYDDYKKFVQELKRSF